MDKEVLHQKLTLFFDRVKDMRDSQKKYFKTRDMHDLQYCKVLEIQVDEIIKDLNNTQRTLNLK